MSDEPLWKTLIESNKASMEAAERVLRESGRPIEVVRSGLRGEVIEVLSALGLVLRMPDEHRIALFPDVLRLCLVQKFAPVARDVALSLPRDWLAANIHPCARAALANGDHLEYLMMIGLCKEVDPNVALELAREAALSSDYDVREVGETFIQSMSGRDGG